MISIFVQTALSYDGFLIILLNSKMCQWVLTLSVYISLSDKSIHLKVWLFKSLEAGFYSQQTVENRLNKCKYYKKLLIIKSDN